MKLEEIPKSNNKVKLIIYGDTFNSLYIQEGKFSREGTLFWLISPRAKSKLRIVKIIE